MFKNDLNHKKSEKRNSSEPGLVPNWSCCCFIIRRKKTWAEREDWFGGEQIGLCLGMKNDSQSLFFLQTRNYVSFEKMGGRLISCNNSTWRIFLTNWMIGTQVDERTIFWKAESSLLFKNFWLVFQRPRRRRGRRPKKWPRAAWIISPPNFFSRQKKLLLHKSGSKSDIK